jgi:signal transduction histidine kinase
MKAYSLARRLMISVLVVQLISAVSITGLAVIYERHTHFRAFDIMLRGRADSLLGAVQDAEDVGDNVMLDGTEVSLPAEDIYEVIDANHRLLGRSSNWTGLEDRDSRLSGGHFFRLRMKGKHYRVLTLDGLRMVDPGDKGGGIARHVTVIYGSPTESVWRVVWRTVAFYAMASLLLLAISGVVMLWLLNRGLAPLRDLAADAAGVSVDSWDFAPSERVRTIEELAPLAGAIETALLGLKRSFVQQRQFVSDAAHELKTAVAVMKSSLQLLTMRHRTALEYEEGLERSYLDCERLQEIVARMLTLARVEDVEARTTAYATDLAASVSVVAEEFETMLRLKNLRLQVLAPGAVVVDVSAEELRLLCSNLILNAIQHSADGSEVRAVVRREGHVAELRVEDDGRGIAKEALPYVFDRFYREDRSRSRETGGTGLGLAICKAIATRYGGEIGIESEAGVGTSVRVRFPSRIDADEEEVRKLTNKT